MDEHFLPAGGLSGSRPLGWMGNTSQAPAHLVRLFARHGFTFTPISKSDSAAVKNHSLVLIDCAGLSVEAVQDYLGYMHASHAELRHALLWVEVGSPYEQLIRWPSVKGIFPSDCSESQLLKGVQSILAGQNWLPRRLLEQCLEKQRTRLPLTRSAIPPTLTERERQILQHVGEASTNAQIAYDLCISEHTVKTHLYNIFRKIQVRNRTEASNWVRQHMQQESVL